MHLTSPDGRVMEVDDEVQIQRLINTRGFRQSNDAEIADYRARIEAMVLAKDQAPAAGDGNAIYYQTVSPGTDGYGMSRDIIKKELFDLGIKLDEDFRNQKVGLLYSYPYGILQFRTDARLIMTMFESDKIPEDWPDYLNAADEVIVPSKWCHDVFAAAGVKSTVVPLGYNDKVFTYVDRPVPVQEGAPFTFIHYNSFNIRKGFSEVFKAFNEEFKPNEPVRLILKSTDRKPPVPIIKSEYPNIEVLSGEVPEAELVQILSRAHCMVYPSRGEGFGITPLEAMATGIPAIVPNAHGISEYFNNNYMLEVGISGKCPGLYQRFKGQDVGEMVICDVKDLRKQMRHAYNNQAEMKELGRAASEYVKHYTYQKTAERLATIIRKWQNTEIIKRVDSKFLQVERV